MNVINVGTIVIIAILFKRVLQIIVFITAFRFLRIYSGGYHATTRIKCYLLTIFMEYIVIMVIKFLDICYWECVVMLIPSSIIICVVSPVECVNKPLDKIEKILYKKNTFVILGVENTIAIICMIMKAKSLLVCIALAECMVSVALISEKIKRKVTKK